MTRPFRSLVSAATFVSVTLLAATLGAQTTPPPAAAPTAPPPASAPPPAPPAPAAEVVPSVILKPALDSIQQTLTQLHPEKWKISGVMKQETQGNINSIQTDLKTTLPPLLTTADQHPDFVAEVLPAFRNISALYDVLLRVAQVAMIAAPAPQSLALQQTITSFDKARREMGDSVQSNAEAEDRRFTDVQTQLHTLQNTPPPAPVVCPAPAPPPAPKKRKPKAKAATPATTTP